MGVGETMMITHRSWNSRGSRRGGAQYITAEGEQSKVLLGPAPATAQSDARGMGCNVVSHYTVALSRDGCEQGGIQSEYEGKVSTIGRLPFGHHGHGQILIVIRADHNYKYNFNKL